MIVLKKYMRETFHSNVIKMLSKLSCCSETFMGWVTPSVRI